MEIYKIQYTVNKNFFRDFPTNGLKLGSADCLSAATPCNSCRVGMFSGFPEPARFGFFLISRCQAPMGITDDSSKVCRTLGLREGIWFSWKFRHLVRTILAFGLSLITSLFWSCPRFVCKQARLPLRIFLRVFYLLKFPRLALCRSIMTTFYAVAKGKKPGIYRTWEQCQQQVFLLGICKPSFCFKRRSKLLSTNLRLQTLLTMMLSVPSYGHSKLLITLRSSMFCPFRRSMVSRTPASRSSLPSPRPNSLHSAIRQDPLQTPLLDPLQDALEDPLLGLLPDPFRLVAMTPRRGKGHGNGAVERK